MAWTLQTQQALRLEGGRVYEIMDQVRGRREVQLEQLKAFALETRIVAAVDEDGVRFSYPGFQSDWCAQYLVDSGCDLSSQLDDITATLGRRSRVRHWEDTLVLMAGMMDAPERLIGRILAGSSMSPASRRFSPPAASTKPSWPGAMSAASGQPGPRQPGVAIDADEGIERVDARPRHRVPGTVEGPASVSHLVSLVIGRVRPTHNGQPTFELSGLRHAALQVLLTMQEEADAYINAFAAPPRPRPPSWRSKSDRAVAERRLRRPATAVPVHRYRRAAGGHCLRAGCLGGRRQPAIPHRALLSPGTAEDAQWSIVDSFLFFDPGEVTRKAVTKLRANPALHSQAAYIIGKLRVAEPGSDEARFLVSCLKSDKVKTRGVALKALAQLGMATIASTASGLPPTPGTLAKGRTCHRTS